MRTFGEVLKEARAQGRGRLRNWTNRDIAVEFRVSVETVRHWLHGKRLPPRARFEKILDFFAAKGIDSRDPALLDKLASAWRHAQDDPASIAKFSELLRVCIGLCKQLAVPNRVWTREGLSREIDVSVHTIGNWERNKAVPSPQRFQRLLDILQSGSSVDLEQDLIGELKLAWNAARSDWFRSEAPAESIGDVNADGRPDIILSAPSADVFVGGSGKDDFVFAEELLELKSIPEPVDVSAPRRGRALFRVPRNMWSEISELAEVRLVPTDELTVQMRAALERTMFGRGKRTEEFAVEPLGLRMRAQLLGEDRFFSIEPLSTEVQTISDAAIHWDWRVTPKREGYSLLTLRISMVADAEGEDLAIDAQALHQSIVVRAKSWTTRPTRFVRDNWKWMLGSSGVGAIAAISALLMQ